MPPPPLEKPLEEMQPPPSPTDIGPKTSPTGAEQHEEPAKEEKVEQPDVIVEPEIPAEEGPETFAEGAELVPIREVDDEEMHFEGK